MYRSHPIQRSLPREAPLLTEIDARTIAGNGGTVTLYLCAGAPRYLVDVANAAGEEIANIAAETPSEALEAFRHPFARPDVPDIFCMAAA